MIKHVGRHGQKKIVLLFREVPGEDHMCLVLYSETLPRLVHDEVMKVLESPSGQQSQNLADALHRNIMANGENTLQSLHKQGLIKKVSTNQILITPNSQSSVKLNELNKILNEMALGKDAVRRLADIEAAKTSDSENKEVDQRDVGEPVSATTTSAEGVLSDQDLARQRLEQANRMKADAERLINEAQLLIIEAERLDPNVKLNEPSKKKTTAKTKKN